ncbi:uncharacterized protein LOC111572360 [Amphiprion ocellaris]|uniref:uncharacterized protein LOC111572360 n=1 Tax=Amphiprion ocellaris TaxID=80972 RepID=UPI000C317161|nr:uncharacterized protein LOC111572360 [Amphiprion ocellaris]
MCIPLGVFLSTMVLHSVSAGGVYCAKTARARAAALGLDYPGVHGAPDLYGPPHHAAHPQPYNNMNDQELASYRQNHPEGKLIDDTIYKQPYPVRSDGFLLSRGTYKPLQSGYTTDQVSGFPRGHSVSNHEPSFEEVKHVALPALGQAPGQSDLVNWDPRGHSKSHSFVYNEHDLVVDESAPNRHGMSLSELPLPKTMGHVAYQRGLTGYGLGREVPVLGSSRFIKKGHTRARMSQGPVFGSWIRSPGRPPQYLHRSLNVQPFVQGNAVLRRLIKPKIKFS